MDAQTRFEDFKNEITTSELPALGPVQRGGVLSTSRIEELVRRFASAKEINEESVELLLSLALLWHDHLEASHRISQNIGSADGSLVHALMHRREPDYGNSKYWLRQAGGHPAYPEISRRVSQLPGAGVAVWLKELVRGGNWDPFAFVDACERVVGKEGLDEESRVLREVQHIEFNVLLERFCNSGNS